MKLIEPSKGASIAGIRIPQDFYWVLGPPVPLAGMRYPASNFPWPNVEQAGFAAVVSLHHGPPYDPTPLKKVFSEQLQDLVGGGPPNNSEREKERIERAVQATITAWNSGAGVVVHCVGGRGRSGTVIGCFLRELGFGSREVIEFLDRLHKERGKPGWPESPWQSALVTQWRPVA
jgi:protein-tyrosine phosphatase